VGADQLSPHDDSRSDDGEGRRCRHCGAGENLDKNNVAELFLTDNKSDFKVQITEQSATAIKFTVPGSVKPGRFGLVIRTPGTQANPVRDYVQPVRVTVE